MFSCGVDIGGTTVRAAALSRDGTVLHLRRAETPRDLPSLIAWLGATMSQICPSRSTPYPLGLAVPGVINSTRTRVVRSVNLSFLEGVELFDVIRSSASVRPLLCTDADAATWGEYRACGSPPARFIHLRLGTGVACGLVVDGRLEPTDPQRTTHWQELVVDQGAEARPCPCGLRGCLETVASGDALLAEARKAGFHEGLSSVQAEFEKGAPAAHDLVVRAARAVGTAVVNLHRRLTVQQSSDRSPTQVSVGGGVVTALPALVSQLIRRFADQTCGPQPAVAIHPAALGDQAGVIGAGLLSAAPLSSIRHGEQVTDAHSSPL